MNIDDFEAPECPDTWPEIVTSIFDRQRSLMNRYKEIEGLPEPPVSLHHPMGQRIIRDFAWRATEELSESFEAFVEFLESDADARHRHHQFEEIGDALHFLVELLIFAGISSKRVGEECPSPSAMSREGARELKRSDLANAYWDATYQLGIAMNFLRNKAWKQHHVPTDEKRFREQLMTATRAHFALWFHAGLGERELHDYYFRKAEVNAFRQRSLY